MGQQITRKYDHFFFSISGFYVYLCVYNMRIVKAMEDGYYFVKQ